MPNIQFQFRRGTAAEWSSANPILAAGEIGIETNTKLFKMGDGVTSWNSLAYGGIQGIQGYQGTQGTQGVQGLQGTQGTQGVQGLQGTQGTQGVQGIQGTQGSQGVQGLQGTQGTQGVQGIQGTQGSQGIQGTQGTQGTQGILGTFSLRVSTSTTTSSLSWNSANYDMYELTAQSGDLTIPADSASSPVHGQKNIFSIKCSSAGQFNLTYNVAKGFRLIGVTVPNSLTLNNYLYLACIYNANDSSGSGKWHVVAVKEGT